MTRTLEFGGKQWGYGWWKGERLSGTADKPISIDTETTLIRRVREPREGEDPDSIPLEPLDIPTLALGMACDSERLVLIHPDRIADFALVHRSQHVVGQNFAFDFHVLLQRFRCDRNAAAVSALWEWGDGNRIHDTMILDMLMQLAKGKYRHAAHAKAGEDTKIFPANLAVLSEEYGVPEVSKEDEHRLRFGELVGLSESEMDAYPGIEGFYSYALKDVLATYAIYPKQRAEAVGIMRECGWRPDAGQKTFQIHPDAVRKWGPLGESIQVKGSITLAQLSREPLRIDQKRRAELERLARERYAKSLEEMLARDEDLVKKYTGKKRKGELKTTKKSALPQFNQDRLIAILEAEALRLGAEVPISDGKLKRTSTSAKAWAKYESESPFIAAWIELENTGKLLEFLTGLNADQVYSRYSLLMRTGRTSAGAHKVQGKPVLPSLNIQQVPRPDKEDPLKNVRTLITADPGYEFYTVDIVYAELRTLAASCLARFGFSKLADAVKDHTLHGGLDPHERAALAVLDLTESEFKAKVKEERKTIRQKVKAFSFGVPGGLGAKKLVIYAEANYGVHLTQKQAKEAKVKFLEAYPEIKLHLGDHTEEALAFQLGLPLRSIPKVREFQKIRWSNWMRGEGELTDGEKDYFWGFVEGLIRRAKREDLYEAVGKRELTQTIKNLFLHRTATLTGLIRANVNYSQGANLPMQSLCSSAAKEVLWKLLRHGFTTKIFLHDEVVVQLPERTAKADAKRIEELINKTLADVIGMGIPMAVEGGLAKTWQKV